jgi:hypothetical protein
MIRSIAMALIASAVLGAAQQSAITPDETARRQDIYAVYSALFADPDPNNSVYLMFGTGGWIVLEERPGGNWQTRPEWVHCVVNA